MRSIDVVPIATNEIEVKKRLRLLNDDYVKVLAETIKANGLQHPIAVTTTTNGYRLVTGAHRLAAFISLGEKRIPAQIIADDPRTIREWEIVENAARHDLTALDRAIHFGEWHALMEVKAGGDRRSNRQNGGLIDEMASRLKVSKRSLERYLTIYKGLAAETRERLKKTALADDFVQLEALRKEEPVDQLAILDLMTGEKSAPKNVAAAASLYHNKVRVADPDEAGFKQFKKLWGRASRKLRRQIKAHIAQNGGPSS